MDGSLRRPPLVVTKGCTLRSLLNKTQIKFTNFFCQKGAVKAAATQIKVKTVQACVYLDTQALKNMRRQPLVGH